MASGYSRTVRFDATGGSISCVELPAPPRGVVERLIISQISGNSAGGPITVYDRKGACAEEADLHIDESGNVTSVADASGFASITFGADHNLKVGDSIEIKGSNQAAYNVTHTVTSITSVTVAVTDVAYTVAGTGGFWQTSPFLATTNPESHIVYEDTVVAATTLKVFDILRGYENRDNQSETMRARHAGLWLEFAPDSTGAQVWEIAITVVSEQLI